LICQENDAVPVEMGIFRRGQLVTCSSYIRKRKII
jgi:hypothetical protein